MDLLAKHFNALVHLLFGGVFAIGAVQAFVKHRSIREMVLWLPFAAAFTALGLLDLMGLMAPEWLHVSGNAVLGILLIWVSISALYSPPSPSFPDWTKWAMLACGVGYLLDVGLRYYWL